MIIPVSANISYKNIPLYFSSNSHLSHEERRINKRINIDRAKGKTPYDCHFDVRRIKKIKANHRLHIENFLCSDSFKNRLRGCEIKQLFENINDETAEFVLPFLSYQKKYNKRNGSNLEILGHVDNALFAVNQENKPAIPKILLFGEKNNIPLRELSYVIQATKKKNINYLDTFLNKEYSHLKLIDKNLSIKDFSDILSNINNKNFNLYRTITTNKKDFSIGEIKVLTAIKNLQQYKGITNVNQLTINQQRKLLNNILTKCNQLIINKSPFIENNYPIIPITQEKYNVVLTSLFKNLKVTPTEPNVLNWYEMMQLSEKKKDTAKEIAFQYRKTKLEDLHNQPQNYSEMKVYEEYKNLVEHYINKYKTTSFVFPQTKIPTADKISPLHEMRSGNISNKVIRINEYTNFQQLGFDKGVTYNNFYAIAHSFCNNEFNKLNYTNKLLNLDIFENLNTKNVISASFIDAQNHRTFRKYGVILDVPNENILGGYYRDFASEFNKTDRMFIYRYVNGNKKNFIDYYAKQFREHLDYDKNQYIEFLTKTQNCKTLEDFEKTLDKNTFAKYLEFIKNIERRGAPNPSRKYNEIFIKGGKPSAVYAYNSTYTELPTEFKQYAQDKNIPIILFDDTRIIEPEPKIWF